MSQQDLIYIWRGERVLVPQRLQGGNYRLYCVSGSGLVRVMSRSRPYRIKADQSLLVPAKEVVTVSGSEDMVITLKPETDV